MKDLKPILEAHPFVRGLSQEHVDLLVGCASNKRFHKGDYLGRAGKKADLFYFIREGTVALEISGAQRGRLTIQTLHDGDALGWSWLITPYRWHFDVRAITPTRTISLDGPCLRGKCESDHELGYEIMSRIAHMMEQRLTATNLQLLDIYAQH